MKYSSEIYESSNYFKAARNTRIRTKLVKTRFPHTCMLCGNQIDSDSFAIGQTILISNTGARTGHICIQCADKWLEATHQV